jgi:hypothetical protein
VFRIRDVTHRLLTMLSASIKNDWSFVSLHPLYAFFICLGTGKILLYFMDS